MDIFQDASSLGFGDIHFKFDPATGLRAIIAIHNTHLGPALGGCRCVSYPSTEAAIVDAMRRGASDFLVKPFSLAEVRAALARALNDIDQDFTLDDGR